MASWLYSFNCVRARRNVSPKANYFLAYKLDSIFFKVNLTQNNYTTLVSTNKSKDPNRIQSVQPNVLIPKSVWPIVSSLISLKTPSLKFPAKGQGRAEPGFTIRNHKGTATTAQRQDSGAQCFCLLLVCIAASAGTQRKRLLHQEGHIRKGTPFLQEKASVPRAQDSEVERRPQHPAPTSLSGAGCPCA